MSTRKATKEKEKLKDTKTNDEEIWWKADEVNQKDQREYSITIGRPGVFKLVLKRNEKGISLGIKRPVCLVKLIKGQDVKSGPVLEQHTRVGDSSHGDILHVIVIRDVPCTIYLRIWAMMPGGLSKMPFRAAISVMRDKDPAQFAPPAPAPARADAGRAKALTEAAPKLTMTEQADVVISYVCAWLEKRASSVAGLYRRAPAEGKTEALKAQFSAGAEVDLDAVEEPSIVAHAFRRWLASNPPLLTYEFFNSFSAANSTTDPQGRAAALSRVMDNLPPQSRASVMRVVLLLRAVDVAAKNPVDTAFLVSLFAPCFLRRFGDPIPQQPDGSGVAYSLVKFITSNSQLIFNTTSIMRDEQARKIAPEEEAQLERQLRESQVNVALNTAERIQRERTATQIAAETMNSNYRPLLVATPPAPGATNYVAVPAVFSATAPPLVFAPQPVPAPTSPQPQPLRSVRTPSPAAPRPGGGGAGDKSPRPGQQGTYTAVPSFPAPQRPSLDANNPPLAPTMTRHQQGFSLAPMSPISPAGAVATEPPTVGRASDGGIDLERLVGGRSLSISQLAQMLVDGKIEEVDLYLLAMPENEANETLRLVREELSVRLAQLNDP